MPQFFYYDGEIHENSFDVGVCDHNGRWETDRRKYLGKRMTHKKAIVVDLKKKVITGCFEADVSEPAKE